MIMMKMNFLQYSFPVFLSVVLTSLCARANHTDPELPEQVRQALVQAAHTLTTEAAFAGGYLGAYSPDFSEGFGKLGVRAERHWNWVENPGTSSMGLAYLKAWQATGEPDLLAATMDVAGALLRGQLVSGGWFDYIDQSEQGDKWIDYRRSVGAPAPAPGETPPRAPRGVRYHEASSTTLDDNITSGAIRFLLRLDQALEQKGARDPSIYEAVRFALDNLCLAQNEHGGWPQNFPTMEGARASYDDYSTYNDHAHFDTLDVLMAGYRAYGDARYRAAVVRGGEFILKTQLPEPTPLWAGQYDADLQPGQARRGEPATEFYPPESSAIVQLLPELTLLTGDLKYLSAVAPAVDWFQRNQTPEGAWFRRYEMITSRPMAALDASRFPHARDWALWWYADAHPEQDVQAAVSPSFGARVPEAGEMARRIEQIGVAEYERLRQPYQWTENPLTGGGPRFRILAPEERLTPADHLERALQLEPQVRSILSARHENGLWLGSWFRLPGRPLFALARIQSNMSVLSDYLLHLKGADQDAQ